MLFGDRIKELREEQGLLQRQLAVALGVDVPMFSKIERGDRCAKWLIIIPLITQKRTIYAYSTSQKRYM